MSKKVKVANKSDLSPGNGMAVDANNKSIALFQLDDGSYCAINNKCTHVGGPLGEGQLEGNIVTCPWHGARFDVTSGECLGPLAKGNVASYPVFLEGDDIFVEINRA